MQRQIHPLIVATTFTCMVAALLWSRAALGILQGVWLLLALVELRNSFFRVLTSEIVIWSFIPVLVYLLVGLTTDWSETDNHLLSTTAMLPIAAISTMAFPYFWKENWWKQSWVILACCSTVLPISSLVQSLDSLSNIYGSGQVAEVWMEKDHVRYSLFVSLGVLLLLQTKLFNKLWQYLLLGYLILFLVVLGVRTGWMVLLLIGVVEFIKIIKSQSAKKLKWLLILAVLMASSVWLLPTVQRKIEYSLYQWESVSGKELVNYSDGTRRIVNKAGITLIQERKTGLGWQKMQEQIDEKIQEQYPNWHHNFSWPFNQWIFWVIGGGWIFGLVLSGWLMYPIIRSKGMHVVALLALVASCLVECTLNYQYGVWLLAWCIIPLWAISLRRG
jgi:hypothetical protein